MDKSEMREALDEAYAALEVASAEVARLQRILDSRPAINAGLPDTYVAWSQSIYVMEITGSTPPGAATVN